MSIESLSLAKAGFGKRAATAAVHLIVPGREDMQEEAVSSRSWAEAERSRFVYYCRGKP
jgi:hypothetical protein